MTDKPTYEELKQRVKDLETKVAKERSKGKDTGGYPAAVQSLLSSGSLRGSARHAVLPASG